MRGVKAVTQAAEEGDVVTYDARLWPRYSEELRAERRAVMSSQLRRLNSAVAQELGCDRKALSFAISSVRIPQDSNDGDEKGEGYLGLCVQDDAGDYNCVFLWLTRGWSVTAVHEIVHAYVTDLTEDGVRLIMVALLRRLMARQDLADLRVMLEMTLAGRW